MATFHQIKQGLGEAWENLRDGWTRLYRQAGGAITRFRHDRKKDNDREITRRSAGWGVLACEVFDDDDRVIVRLEAPGMKVDDFDLEVIEDFLVVRGEKRMERERTQGGYYITECAYGSFERAIPLPDTVETHSANASYKNGVLRVDLPKSGAHRRRRIKIAA